MLTGEIRSKVDALWNVFRTAGISNPPEVIGQTAGGAGRSLRPPHRAFCGELGVPPSGGGAHERKAA